MFRLILKRLLLLIPVLIGVTFLVFSILSLAPGDPVLVVLGDNATEEAAEAMRSELGLDKPFLERYVNYIWDLLHGDFGKSYKTKLSVSDQILSRFPNTILLALSSMLIALLLGIPLGILSAKKQYSLLDNVASVGGLISVSMPNFWLGLLLVILFALKLRWLPSQGMGEGTGPMLKSLILPAVTLGTGIMATIMRMTRSSVLETMRQDYVSTARAKGISESQVTTRHMLKNALIPIITSAGLQFGHLLGGSMLTETVFSWPGVGRYMLDAIKTKDTPAVLGSVILMSVSSRLSICSLTFSTHLLTRASSRSTKSAVKSPPCVQRNRRHDYEKNTEHALSEPYARCRSMVSLQEEQARAWRTRYFHFSGADGDHHDHHRPCHE